MVNKLKFILLIWLLSGATLQAQSDKVNLLDHWFNPNLPRLNGYQIWNDLTGYTDTITGKEYIIAGSTDSIYFFDISNPSNIVLVDVADGKSKQMVNRDYECYSHYVYCVSDNRNAGSLQVFDLQYLPDSVHKVYDSDTIAFNTHSIFIEASSKRLYMCINRTKSGKTFAMDIVSLEQPETPVKIGTLEVPDLGGTPAFSSIHEVFVRNDTAWCSAEYSGLWVFDLRDLTNQRLLSVITNYPENGYNHSSVLDPSGKYLMFTDEVPSGLAIKIFDVSNLSDPKLVSTFESSALATAHNAYWVGNFAYISYYQDGFVVFDISNPFNPIEAGYYRTLPYPPANYEGYNGCWGVYPWFPSGTIAVSDMQEGIFTLKPDKSITGVTEKINEIQINVYPNPTSGKAQFSIPQQQVKDSYISILNLKGELLLHKPTTSPTFEINLEEYAAGVYILQLSSGNFTYQKKLVKL